MQSPHERIATGLEWEELRFVEEEAELLGLAQDEIQKIRSDLNSRGILHSSLLTGSVFEAHLNWLEQAVNERIRLRQEIVRTVRELASPAHFARFSESLERFINTRWRNMPGLMVRWCREMASEDDLRKEMDSGAWAAHLEHLNNRARHRLKVLEREVVLGMGEPRADQSVLFTGPVGAVNLGTIQGDMNTAISTLTQQPGGDQVARALTRLAEAVQGAPELADQRQEILEGLVVIIQEAGRPIEERKGRLVKGLLERWGPVLGAAGSLAEIWNAVEPVVTAWFGGP